MGADESSSVTFRVDLENFNGNKNQRVSINRADSDYNQSPTGISFKLNMSPTQMAQKTKSFLPSRRIHKKSRSALHSSLDIKTTR